MSLGADYYLPSNYEWGSDFGSGFNTNVFKRDSGLEGRFPLYDGGRRPYSVSYINRTRAWITTNIINPYHALNGKLYGMKFQDRLDYSTAPIGTDPLAYANTDQPVVQDDLGNWRIAKVYGGTIRFIYKPHPTEFAVSGGLTGPGLANFLETGILNAGTSGLTWGGLFYVPVRFDGPLTVDNSDYETCSVRNLQLRELKYRS